MGAYPQICQHPIELHAQLGGIILNKAEVVVNQGKPCVLGRIGQGVRVTIEGDELSAIM